MNYFVAFGQTFETGSMQVEKDCFPSNYQLWFGKCDDDVRALKLYNEMTVISRVEALCCTLLLLLHHPSESAVQMLSKGKAFFVYPGEAVHLECEFSTDQFNLFDNPILWRKIQRQEETQMNMMGNLMEPFESTRRFRVSFVAKPARYSFTLNLADTYLEDSGNYTCEVNGPQNALLGAVTHYIYVRAAIESMFISSGNGNSTQLELDPYEENSLVFVENQPCSLQCVAHGGYPPPDMTLHIGKRDVTSEFVLGQGVQLTGVRSLRVMQYTTTRTVTQFVARASDDGKRMRCVVTVAGLASNTSFARITVNYAPIITCEPGYARTGEKNVFIRCEVRAKPDVGAMFWIIDVNGTTVSEGEVINEYWTLVMDRSDGVLETQLFLRRTKLDSFRRYTIVAENSVAVRTQDVALVQKSTSTSAPEVVTPKTRSANREAGTTAYRFTQDQRSRTVSNRAFTALAMVAILRPILRL